MVAFRSITVVTVPLMIRALQSSRRRQTQGRAKAVPLPDEAVPLSQALSFTNEKCCGQDNVSASVQ